MRDSPLFCTSPSPHADSREAVRSLPGAEAQHGPGRRGAAPRGGLRADPRRVRRLGPAVSSTTASCARLPHRPLYQPLVYLLELFSFRSGLSRLAQRWALQHVSVSVV